jgi:phage terminase large subunit-like protein
VQAEPNECLDLWARFHYKSTIITFGLTIQDILRSHGEDAPVKVEDTICIFSQTRPIAKKFLAQIKSELETNRQLQNLFPDVLYTDPQSQSTRWSLDDGLIVKRQGNPKEATLEAFGLVDGQPAGPHYHKRVYDDTVTEKSVTTPEMIAKTTKMWELSQSLKTEDGIARYIGTTYALFDTYRTMKDRGIKVRRYPCTKDGTDNIRAENCVLYPPEFLQKTRRDQGPSTFATQMLLDPKAGMLTGFKEEWLKYWPARKFANLNFVIIVDPASKKKKTSDYSAFWVVGLGADGNYYVADYHHDRLNLRQRVELSMNLHRKWKPKLFCYEEYGMQADIEAIEWQQEEENYRFAITPLGGPLKKDDRIKRLQPLFETGRIFLPEGGCVHVNYEGVAVDTIRGFVSDEYMPFPMTRHDDGLDGLSRIEDDEVKLHLTKPTDGADNESKFMQELMSEHYRRSSGGNASWQGR